MLNPDIILAVLANPTLSEELATILRSATRGDIPSILALERRLPALAHWSEQAYRKIFETGAPERILLVIEDEAGPQGFLVARFGGAECELENIVIAAAQQRRGLGARLLKSLIVQAAERKIERVLLEVRESNVAARALYEKVGFCQTGRRKSYYHHPQEDALLYTLWSNCTTPCAEKR